jgi:hypothetical protein
MGLFPLFVEGNSRVQFWEIQTAESVAADPSTNGRSHDDEDEGEDDWLLISQTATERKYTERL